MTVHREKKTKEKVVVRGFILKGYLPKGEEWFFVPDDGGEKILHTPHLEGLVKNLRKRSADGSLKLKFNQLPQTPVVVDSFDVKVRTLYQDEILFYSQVIQKVRRKSQKISTRSSHPREVHFFE